MDRFLIVGAHARTAGHAAGAADRQADMEHRLGPMSTWQLAHVNGGVGVGDIVGLVMR